MIEKIIIIFVSIFVLSYTIIPLIAIHKLFLRAEKYRWFINSLIYPYHFLKVRKMAINKVVLNIAKFEVSEFWFSKYWFGKAIKKQLLKRYENYLKSKGEI